ncbi:MAG: hypothetical protein HZY79_15990 [Rhodoblastus sp.]|nr:MAG: hypothetical protein HZY79_15990 [Rhodoblastus sp.]
MRGILKAAAFAGVATAAVASAMTGAITGAGQAWATPQICEYRAPEQWRP